MNTKINNQIDMVVLYQRVLFIYLISLLFFYPYGIKEVGLRISDILSLCLIVLGVIIIFKSKNLNKIIVFIPIILLFLFEVIYPLFGVLLYNSFSPLSSSLRMIFLYLPLLFFASITNECDYNQFVDKITSLLKLSLILNLIYSILQNFVSLNLLPTYMLVTLNLQQFAVDDHFRVIDGIRASGFFINTTSLAIFSLVTLIYFATLYLRNANKSNITYVVISILLIVLTTSRAIAVVALLVLILLLISIAIKMKSVSRLIKLSAVFVIGLLIIYYYLQNLFELDEFFKRFIRISEGGLGNDYSFSYRLEYIWPQVMVELKEYTFGTLENPTKIIGLIDSGYLTYYAQGKIVGLLVVLINLLGIIYFLFVFLKRRNVSAFYLTTILLFVSMSMIVNNPLRSPILIFFLCIGLLNYYYESYNKQII